MSHLKIRRRELFVEKRESLATLNFFLKNPKEKMEIDIVEGRDPRTIDKLPVNNHFWKKIKCMKNNIKGPFGH